MNVKSFPSPNEAAAFEAGYLASTLRARREFTWAQRAAIIDVLTSAPPAARAVATEIDQPGLRSFALILARCESAAILLGWRKEITPAQKCRLDAAIHQLQEAATQVAVRVPAQSAPAVRRPADTTAASPTVTPGPTNASAQIHAWSRMTIGGLSNGRSGCA